MSTPYGTILDSSAAGVTRLVLTDGGLTLQTLTLTHEITLPTGAVDGLLAALRQEAKDALPQSPTAFWHWSQWKGHAACNAPLAQALLTPFPEDVTCAVCLDAWLSQATPVADPARAMALELQAACVGIRAQPPTRCACSAEPVEHIALSGACGAPWKDA